MLSPVRPFSPDASAYRHVLRRHRSVAAEGALVRRHLKVILTRNSATSSITPKRAVTAAHHARRKRRGDNACEDEPAQHSFGCGLKRNLKVNLSTITVGQS